MSLEKIFFTPSSPEDEPVITMNLPEGVEITLERTNTALYTYMGNLAVFNHAYYVGTEKKTPFYIFQGFTPPDDFTRLRNALIKFEFPHFTNQGWVDETDIASYEAYAKKLDSGSIEDVVESWASSED